ncbi:hypothetical protein [Clostridium cylindrosporum]|uniref:Uncharacterized protein n=1 Tax=Clostridium cylindrosporum DSM 605 TaxID=1121307 RepID=A0A0J8DAW4_CLOCY|nr:hypothetical protein [Clostridium cylindrosporum]KMT23190.1 hypothetical protein CLCY_6c00710 [Clostridium cylindrosporum DSM 605]
MLELPFIEFLFRAIPEAFLFVFAILTFSKFKVKVSRFMISGFVVAISFLLIRSLPINYGVHTVLSLIAIIVTSSIINKIDIISCIKASILILIIQLLCEGLNVFIIEKILDMNISEVFANPIQKIFYGIPSLLVIWIVVLICYFLLKRRRQLKNV